MKTLAICVIGAATLAIVIWGVYQIVQVERWAKEAQRALDEWYEGEKELNRMLIERSREGDHETDRRGETF